MKTQQYKGVIFDFGGVISQTLFETHRQSERALGLEVGTLDWRGPFDPDSDPLWQSMQAGQISERDYWLTRAEQVGQLLGQKWTTMHQLVYHTRSQNPNDIIRPEARQTIDRLHQAGIFLAILSNELELFYGQEILTRLDFLNQFGHIQDASHSDILKPDPRIYQECLAKMSLDSHACIFVDDQPKNIQGAVAVGLTTVAFDVRHPQASYNELLTLLNLPILGES